MPKILPIPDVLRAGIPANAITEQLKHRVFPMKPKIQAAPATHGGTGDNGEREEPAAGEEDGGVSVS